MKIKFLFSCVIVVALFLILAFPVQADAEITKELDASIVGLAEFYPGDNGVVQVSVQNNNVADTINTSSIQVGLASYFGAAVSLSAQLGGGSVLDVKTSKALIGTLNAGMATPPVPFNIKVNDNAAPGNYPVDLTLTYRTLKSTSGDQTKVTTEWSERTDVKTLTVTVKDRSNTDQKVDFSVARVDSNSFSPGDTGTIQLCLQNNKSIGKIEVSTMQTQTNLSPNYGSAVSLAAHVDKGQAPVTIKTGDILLGTLAAGQATPPLPVAIEVDANAAPGTYPIDVSTTYKTLKSTSIKDGNTQLDWADGSGNYQINLEIKDKLLKFEVTAVEANLSPGARTEIKVTFKNNGIERARDATVKLSASSPLSMTDNAAFLGNIEPGATAVGTFGLKVMGDAIAKEYTLDASVQYTNTKKAAVASEVFKVPVVVSEASTPLTVIRDQWMAAAAGAGVIIIAWVAFGMVRMYRRKRS